MLILENLIDQATKSPIGQSRGWINDEKIKIYVRIGRRAVDSEMVQCLQIATVEVEEGERQTGRFSRFIEKASAYKLPIFIENLSVPEVAASLVKKGFRVLRTDDIGQQDLFRPSRKATDAFASKTNPT